MKFTVALLTCLVSVSLAAPGGTRNGNSGTSTTVSLSGHTNGDGAISSSGTSVASVAQQTPDSTLLLQSGVTGALVSAGYGGANVQSSSSTSGLRSPGVLGLAATTDTQSRSAGNAAFSTEAVGFGSGNMIGGSDIQQGSVSSIISASGAGHSLSNGSNSVSSLITSVPDVSTMPIRTRTTDRSPRRRNQKLRRQY